MHAGEVVTAAFGTCKRTHLKSLQLPSKEKFPEERDAIDVYARDLKVPISQTPAGAP